MIIRLALLCLAYCSVCDCIWTSAVSSGQYRSVYRAQLRARARSRSLLPPGDPGAEYAPGDGPVLPGSEDEASMGVYGNELGYGYGSRKSNRNKINFDKMRKEDSNLIFVVQRKDPYLSSNIYSFY